MTARPAPPVVPGLMREIRREAERVRALLVVLERGYAEMAAAARGASRMLRGMP